MMLKELKFVQGAVSTKDFIPALTHFRIQNGTVRSYNGVLALCSPIALDIDCIPKAVPLVKAIGHCTETVSLNITPTGRLSVKSGSFKALIDCVQEETPHVVPEGDYMEIDGEMLLKALKVIYPFIGDDASRPWTNGVLLKGKSAFATNNVTLIEFWIGTEIPKMCNIPRACIKEMIRIGEPPVSAQIAENSITFHYEENMWIRSQLFSTEWPNLEPILTVEDPTYSSMQEEMFEGLEKIKSFVDKIGHVYMEDNYLRTSHNAEEGAEFHVHEMDINGIFNIDMLQILKGVANKIDFTKYPKPCPFLGDRIRGVIIGMKP